MTTTKTTASTLECCYGLLEFFKLLLRTLSCLVAHEHLQYIATDCSFYHRVPILESNVMSGPEKIRSRGSWSHIVSKATDA